jgi:cyclase
MSILKRLIATVIVKDGKIVNRYQFRRSLPVGAPRYTMEALERWELDEICVLDISGPSLRSRSARQTQVLVESFSGWTPLAVGGGIASAHDAKLVIQAGAERVVLGGAAFVRPSLVAEVSEEVGEQAVVVSVPFVYEDHQLFWSMPRWGRRRPLGDVLSCIGHSFRGEILLQSMVHDGIPTGSDLPRFVAALQQMGSLKCLVMGGLTTATLLKGALDLEQVSGVCVGNRMHAEELLSPRLKLQIDLPVRAYRGSDHV